MPRVRPIAALLADYLLNESSFDLQQQPFNARFGAFCTFGYICHNLVTK